MGNTRSSPELERLKRLLVCGPQSEPSAALRQRVLDDVHAELRQRLLNSLRRELERDQRRSRRWFAAACAATLLIGLSISLSVVRVADVALQPPPATASVNDVARQLQQLSPEVSRKDSFVQATLRQIGPEANYGEILNNIFADTNSHDP